MQRLFLRGFEGIFLVEEGVESLVWLEKTRDASQGLRFDSSAANSYRSRLTVWSNECLNGTRCCWNSWSPPPQQFQELGEAVSAQSRWVKGLGEGIRNGSPPPFCSDIKKGFRAQSRDPIPI